MAEFDLIVRNGLVATAADEAICDVGIKDGRIAALGASLAGGSIEIDASDCIVTPGGIDAHCHLDQPMSDGSHMADDFETGSIDTP